MPISEPQIPKAEDLYNALMQGIEPELTTDQIPLLEGKYRGETPEQRQARIERYNTAFAAYERAQADYLKDLRVKVKGFKREALKEAEGKSRSEEQGRLTQIESILIA
jgi:hypothetical protein